MVSPACPTTSSAPEERDRLLRIWGGAPPSQADKCFAIRTLFSGPDVLAPELRDRFIRALADLGNKTL
jgi:hypothetical protein